LEQWMPGQTDGGNGAAVFVAWRYAASLVGNGPLAAPSGGKPRRRDHQNQPAPHLPKAQRAVDKENFDAGASHWVDVV
jgi:hypothetical protein